MKGLKGNLRDNTLKENIEEVEEIATYRQKQGISLRIETFFEDNTQNWKMQWKYTLQERRILKEHNTEGKGCAKENNTIAGNLL